MQKYFVLDTNVLLFDPTAIYKFGDNIVYISLVVIEEIDRFKRDQNENGRSARQFSRIVDQLRKEGPLTEGVSLGEKGGKLIIRAGTSQNHKKHAELMNLTIQDNMILSAALALKEKGENVLLVTKDINLRLKADIVGVNAEDYGDNDVKLEEIYSGHKTLKVKESAIQSFEKNRFLDYEADSENPIFANEYLTIQDEKNDRYRVHGRYCGAKKGIVPLIQQKEGVWGIYPKNVEQQFALDALLNDEIKLVSLVGKAGTGKTLLAIAAGLEQTILKENYTRLLVSRPVQPMGKDLGYLPGDINEKLAPWMQPIFDNMDLLFGKKSGPDSWDDLINKGLLHVEPLTYIRGRSIPDQYMIVDEAQNLSPHEIKTIITRAGEGTKIVLTGDCQQIDSPYLDEVNNGLAYCVERFKEQQIVGHSLLVEGERSALSEMASRVL